MSIRMEVLPFLGTTVLIAALAAAVLQRLGRRRAAWWSGLLVLLVLGGYLLYFFRDPERTPPADRPDAILAGADGLIAGIREMREETFLKTEVYRISIFLRLYDVHVNRAPIDGTLTFLQYYPGAHVFTFREKSSDANQHNSLVLEGPATRCLVNQIVGPVCRRVVCWIAPGETVAAGQRLGMMKFGSRLDLYLPRSDVRVTVAPGDRVRAGETVVAVLRTKEQP